MRLLSLFVLLAIMVLVVLFGMQNDQGVALHFFDWSITTTLVLLVAGIYFLGMLSGWTVIGSLRRSVHRVTDAPR